MRLPIFREIFKIWKYPPVLIRWQNDFFSNLFIQKCIRNNFSSISRIFSHNRGTLVFGSVLGVFSMKISKWHCRFKTKKSRNETALKYLQPENDLLIKNFQSKTLRIQQIPGIVFSPRASFSRHPQYTPAPSVYRYRACIKLFAAPSIEHDRLYPSRSPHAVTRTYRGLWPGIPIKIKKISYYINIYHSNPHLLIKSSQPSFQ